MATFVSESSKAGVFVPARTIPAPMTVSAQAQAFLSNPPEMGGGSVPDPRDKAGWRAYIEKTNAGLTATTAAMSERYPTELVSHQVSEAPVYEVIPKELPARNQARAILYIHGGAFTVGGGIAAAYMARSLAHLARIRTFSVDYRMPPDHPFPAGIKDVVAAYQWLLERYKPEEIAVYGPSAGGGLAAAFVLMARDLGMPMPAACVLATPEADLTESGDTFETNDTIDVVLKHRLTESIALYADGHDLRDPYLSPIFGDFSKGFPPTILTSGTRDLFLSNTVLLHRALRRAGIKAELHVFEAMPHGGFFGSPEDEEVFAEQVRFIREQLGTE